MGVIVLAFLRRVPLRVYALLAALLLSAALLWHLNQQLQTERERRVSAEFRVDSVVASNDTTRILLESKVIVSERRTLQLALRADSLDRALKQRPVVRGDLTVRVDTFYAVDSAVVRDSADVRLATFEKYDEPYHVRIGVAVPKPPQPAQAVMQITLDSIPLGVAVTCGQNPDGVRSAFVRARTPEWARLRIESFQQSPDVCNPLPRARPAHKVKTATKVGLLMVLAYLAGKF